MKFKVLDISKLKSVLRYEPHTGLIYWRSGVPKYGGTRALRSVSAKGYLVGGVLGVRGVMAHRAAWALMTGKWPSGQIDHINQDKQDNRWENLRVVSNQENHRNVPRPSNNTTGRVGVYRTTSGRPWAAKIKIDGRMRHLGTFDAFDDACAARQKAERLYGFHPNHGREV